MAGLAGGGMVVPYRVKRTCGPLARTGARRARAASRCAGCARGRRDRAPDHAVSTRRAVTRSPAARDSDALRRGEEHPRGRGRARSFRRSCEAVAASGVGEPAKEHGWPWLIAPLLIVWTTPSR